MNIVTFLSFVVEVNKGIKIFRASFQEFRPICRHERVHLFLQLINIMNCRKVSDLGPDLD